MMAINRHSPDFGARIAPLTGSGNGKSPNAQHLPTFASLARVIVVYVVLPPVAAATELRRNVCGNASRISVVFSDQAMRNRTAEI
jgi:hypothetical protein